MEEKQVNGCRCYCLSSELFQTLKTSGHRTYGNCRHKVSVPFFMGSSIFPCSQQDRIVKQGRKLPWEVTAAGAAALQGPSSPEHPLSLWLTQDGLRD